MKINIRLLYKGAVVGESSWCNISDTTIHSTLGHHGLIESCIRLFGIDFSQYRLSDMKQSPGQIDFRLKDEDYTKLRNDRINKILSE